MKWVMAVLVASLIVACDDGGPPAASVEMATDLGILPTSPTIRGRDGGYSARVFGHSVWLYGDTILAAPDEAGETWHNNSLSFTLDVDATDGITRFSEWPDSVGAPRPFVRRTAAERAFNREHAHTDQAQWVLWPSALVDDPARSRVLIFYGKLLTYPGPFNFHGHGSSIALWSALDAEPERPVVAPATPHPTILFSGDEPRPNEGAVVLDDRLYAYDCRGVHMACVIARAPLAAALDRAAWRFWNGSAWTASWRDAVRCDACQRHPERALQSLPRKLRCVLQPTAIE